MQRAAIGLLGWAALAVGITTGSPSNAADFKRAPDGCKTAHAILGWSDFKDEGHAKLWEIVGYMMHSRDHWEIVDEPEVGVSQKAAFRQFSVKGNDKATAYVAHCGHGATCNAIAATFFKLYRRVGTPAVYCGPLPSVLSTPARVSIPKPSDEDLKRWNEGGDGDGDSDIDDDAFDEDE